MSLQKNVNHVHCVVLFPVKLLKSQPAKAAFMPILLNSDIRGVEFVDTRSAQHNSIFYSFTSEKRQRRAFLYELHRDYRILCVIYRQRFLTFRQLSVFTHHISGVFIFYTIQPASSLAHTPWAHTSLQPPSHQCFESNITVSSKTPVGKSRNTRLSETNQMTFLVPFIEC